MLFDVFLFYKGYWYFLYVINICECDRHLMCNFFCQSIEFICISLWATLLIILFRSSISLIIFCVLEYSILKSTINSGFLTIQTGLRTLKLCKYKGNHHNKNTIPPKYYTSDLLKEQTANKWNTYNYTRLW